MDRFAKPGSFCFALLATIIVAGQQIDYPYPVKSVRLAMDYQLAEMAYMDIKEEGNSLKTIVLLHGKNFNGYYWKSVIPFFVQQGYRVIVPDQIGWGRSDKPDIHYSFHLLAQNTAKLLDTLGIKKITLLGHSMGGMLATRFALIYPDRVDKLILENPIGLEDYKRFIPYRPVEILSEKEKQATYESYKKYQQSYYPQWKPEYEQYVKAQAEILDDPDFSRIAKVNALTYLMIYEQPVCYEWSDLSMPVLLMIGQEDRTVVGKELLSEAKKKVYGQYPSLGRKTAAQLKKGKLVELPGIGHIPHIQDAALFQKHLIPFLRQ